MTTRPVTTSTASIPPLGGAPESSFKFDGIPGEIHHTHILPFLTFFVRVGDRDCSDIANLACTSRFWREQLTQPTREWAHRVQKESSGFISTPELRLFESCMRKYFASSGITCIRWPELNAATDKLEKYRPRFLNLPNAVELNIDLQLVTRGFDFGKELADTLPNLRIFRLGSAVIDRFIEFILRHPQLETLRLRSFLKPAQLSQILQKCPNLKNLSIGGIRDEDFETVHPPVHKNLTHIEMEWDRSLDDLVATVTLFPNLQSLEITRDRNPGLFTESPEVITKRINSILPSLTLTLIERAEEEDFHDWRRHAEAPPEDSVRSDEGTDEDMDFEPYG